MPRRIRFVPDHLRKKIRRGAKVEYLKSLVGTGEADCIPWPFKLHREGYGYTYVNGVFITSSRLMCILAHGEPTDSDLQAAHDCGNRACVNPNHIRWATRLENAADRAAHGTLYGRTTWRMEEVSRRPDYVHKNSKKTHCPQGHPYDEVNTLLYRGGRYCRTCQRERDAGRSAQRLEFSQ